MFGRKKKTEEHHAYDPLRDILDTLDNCLQTPTEIRDDKVYCTEWNVEIEPEIEELTNNSAVLNFYLKCPDWDEPLFECCAGMGGDSKTAIGSAVGSFMFAFMDGIAAMQDNRDAIAVTSEYAGKEHSWRVYRSNIVGMGEEIKPDFEQYWNALKDGIIQRLGNQRMTYVKVYACKVSGPNGVNVTGECRVNDVPSTELGALVYEIAEKFDINGFVSQKLFFFIKQDSQTLLPYRYRMNKIPELREKVKTALELFDKCNSQEEYDKLLGNMAEALKDGPLAEECFGFLPEICAERAFGDKIQFSEQVQFAVDGDTVKIETVYKNQLADFYPLGNLMFMIFDSGYFGDRTNDLYGKLINLSAIGNNISQMMEQGKDLSGCKLTALLFNVTKYFELR